MSDICENCKNKKPDNNRKYCYGCEKTIIRKMWHDHYFTYVPKPRKENRSLEAMEDVGETKFGRDR